MRVERQAAGIRSRFSVLGIALLMFCWTVTGCALIKLKQDLNEGREANTIVGLVAAKLTGAGPIVVAACTTREGREIAHFTILHESGEYELMLDKGRYYIFAYRDLNRNLIYEAGEPAGHYGAPDLVDVPAVGVVFDIDLAITEGGEALEIPHGRRISSQAPEKLHSRQAGDITDLDDGRFDDANGVKGFWEPGSFFRQLGGNIYFLEAYDPDKTPVLFIHGAAGTPRGWRHFVDSLDRSRFQPWFYYYPSGVRLSSVSYLLLWKLVNLQAKYQFDKIYFTAHSMGGLVARSFIISHGRQFPFVRLFISLATPWGGDRMAEYGVRQSPVVMPSWIDMQPEGDFIQSLYRTKLPDYIDFYMFYGHKGSRNPFRSNNDGTINLASLLDPRPQSEAKMNYGFNEDHATILSSKAVLTQYNAILNQYDDQARDPSKGSGGYLRARLTYGFDFDGVRPRPQLILNPKGSEGTEIATLLYDAENGGSLGPFPPGEYLVSIVAPAGKPDKRYVPVTIRPNEAVEVEFHVAAEGEIRGCLADPRKLGEATVGMPDNAHRSEAKKILIESISLKGGGIQRTLQPLRGEYISGDHYLIQRNDVCYNECFAIFGLPAGEYTLEVKAQGYGKLERPIHVVPGVSNKFRITELTPE